MTCGLIGTGPSCSSPAMGFPHLVFFPKRVVHGVEAYGKIEKFDDGSNEFEAGDSDFDLGPGSDDEGDQEMAVRGHGINDKYAKMMRNGMNGEGDVTVGRFGEISLGRFIMGLVTRVIQQN
ncbi:hypothetical protein ACH5RR_004909 [Cinchona calisaya]|uniref:Uncharacterized protein n=1 Tax=Cinchona calisaya TaxID=153742 RepID=A0ABD3AZK1_9GENT